MRQTRRIPSHWLTGAVNVLLVGAGGTGSRVVEQLVCLHRALIGLGHPQGLRVTVKDMDKVTESNIGRQAFYPTDVGDYKAIVLANRVNHALGSGAYWEADVDPIEDQSNLSKYDLVIGAVDNRAARRSIAIAGAVHSWRRKSPLWWLDFGNRSDDGQVILGEIEENGTRRSEKDPLRLPHVGEFYPEMLDPKTESDADTPSCSLAEALEKQSLYINQAVSLQGMNILSRLFRYGEISVHGAFVNLEAATVMPLHVDPDIWARFGVGPQAKRRRKPRLAA